MVRFHVGAQGSSGGGGKKIGVSVFSSIWKMTKLNGPNFHFIPCAVVLTYGYLTLHIYTSYNTSTNPSFHFSPPPIFLTLKFSPLLSGFNLVASPSSNIISLVLLSCFNLTASLVFYNSFISLSPLIFYLTLDSILIHKLLLCWISKWSVWPSDLRSIDHWSVNSSPLFVFNLFKISVMIWEIWY